MCSSMIETILIGRPSVVAPARYRRGQLFRISIRSAEGMSMAVTERPSWVDDELFSFESHFVAIDGDSARHQGSR